MLEHKIWSKNKFILAGALAFSYIACFVPFIRLWGYEISVFDFMGLTSSVGEFLQEYEEYTEFLQQIADSYMTLCMMLVALPLCEIILLLLLKGRNVIIAAALSALVNNVAAFMLYDRIDDTVEEINESFLGLILDEPLKMEPLPTIIWVAVYIVFVAVIIISAAREASLMNQTRKEKEAFAEMKDIMMEQFHFERKEPKDDVENRNPAKNIQLIEDDAAGAFRGGIISAKGAHKDEVYLLKKEEKVSLGSDESDDIFIIGAMEKATYCLISYDAALEEYHVRPLMQNAVLLGGKQPLGKDRAYCIPRGKSLTIDNRKNVFTLA